MSTWEDCETPVYYEAFCRKYSRYARANAALIAHAEINGAMRILDLGAGTGRTAQAALHRLSADGRIVCLEPADAMRAAGMSRLNDPRVTWYRSVNQVSGPFDRILCGAAIWQLEPLPETIRHLAGLLASRGALCFNIPAMYLLEPDDPGGGSDPLLLRLPSLLASTNSEAATSPPAQQLNQFSFAAWLEAAGLRPSSWTFRIRLTQEAYAAWLKIPVLTDGMLPGVAPHERSARIDRALASTDRASWKWERWRGWTAWKG